MEQKIKKNIFTWKRGDAHNNYHYLIFSKPEGVFLFAIGFGW